MVNAFFFDSINGDRSYSADDFATAFGVFLQNGVIPDEDGYYGLSISGTNYSVLNPGKAVIEGHFIDVPVSEPITNIPAGNYNGMVVLRLDVTGERNCTVVVRNDRVPQQNANIWELPLYNVVVAGGIITSIEDIRQGGGALAQTTSKLKGVSNLPIILKSYNQKSWSIQRMGDGSLHFVPSSSVGGEDWDYTKKFHITDNGSFRATGAGFVDGNFDTAGFSYFRNNMLLTKDTSGLELKVNSVADNHQIGLRVTPTGNYMDSVTSNYGAFKNLYIRASKVISNCYFSTTAAEIGWCGIGARVLDNVTNSVAGVGVSFRQVRETVPSSITLTTYSSNAEPGEITAGMITNMGFWLSVLGNNSGVETYLYWRGLYTTV